MPARIMELVDAWFGARVGVYGAAVAYYTVFSLAPILIIIVAIAGLFFDAGAVQAGILLQFTTTFGPNGAALIGTLVSADKPATTNILIAVFGIISILIGATGIFSALQSGLDKIFESFPSKEAASLWGKILRNLSSVGMVLSLGFALIVSLLASAVLSAIGSVTDRFIPHGQVIAIILDLAISFAILAFFMALILKYLPSKRIAWRPAIAGGVIAALFFVIGKYALGRYLGSAKVIDPYGAASSLVFLILWVFYIAQAFFFSAIVARLYFSPRVIIPSSS